jgi:hypothetical protein
MSTTPETGFLVLADLTGYTSYLSRSELEHAPVIAGDLLETVTGRLEPPFRLAKFEGDAAFLWVEDGRAEAALLLDAIEAAYLAFRRRLRSIDQATACDCRSCQLAPGLDLKLFLHHGTWVRSRIAGRDELAGPDVILVHRLLKGTTAAREHPAGFAVFTEAAVDVLGLQPGRLGLVAGQEMIEHLGAVTTHTLDLEHRWQREASVRRLDGVDGAPLVDLDLVVPAPPSVVWGHLTSPTLRATWEGPIRIEETVIGGHRGVGTVNRCVTGRLAMLEEIVDWQPYEHVAWRTAVPDIGAVETTVDIEQAGGGARLRVRSRHHGGQAGESSLERARTERRAAYRRLQDVLAHATADATGTM